MKFNLKIFFLSVLWMLVIVPGCKYEDGPGISLRCREKRVAGAYNIEKFEIGGINLTDSLKKLICFSQIGFTKDGNIDVSREDISCGFYGYWDFAHNDEKITMSFYGADTLIVPLGDYWTLDWDILRLSDDEMNLSVTYENQFIELELKQ